MLIMEIYNIVVIQNTKTNLKMKGLVALFILMEINTLFNGKLIKNKDIVLILIQMTENILKIGKKNKEKKERRKDNGSTIIKNRKAFSFRKMTKNIKNYVKVGKENRKTFFFRLPKYRKEFSFRPKKRRLAF